jgi:polysaccharide pyruvyl transferase WcaK-like protein
MAFLREFDLIISAPQGPTISDMYTLKDKTIFPLRFAKEYGVPYMILGVSMGPFNKFTDDEIEVFKVLENAKAIIVRENISFNHLLNKYPKLNNVTAAVDIVYATGFNLQDKAPNLKETYSKFLLSLGQKEKPIGACISLTPSRDPRNKFNKLEYLAKMKAFFEYVIDKTGKNLILFPHIAFDMPALNQLKETMKNQDRVVIFPESLDSDFQQEFMSKLEFFISSRYHPTIFAIKAGVPFMCIKNQFKVEGMLNDIGLNSETCWQDESLETFIRVFNKNFDDRVTGLENIKHSLGIAKKEAKKYAEVLENYFYKSKVSTRSN